MICFYSHNLYVVGLNESPWRIAIRDVLSGVSNFHLWMFLGWQDIRQRYRRSILGPLWLTMSTGLMILVISILYGQLLGLSMDIYVPFLASGSIVWTLISNLINDGCTSFTAADSIIKQVRLPLTLHVCRVVWRNIIILMHNSLIIIPLWIYYGITIQLTSVLMIAISMLLIVINGFWIGIVLGALCARYRDINQIVTNFVQVAFFVTPVMWMPSLIESRGISWWLLMGNPFFHFIEIVRGSLLGYPISLTSWVFTVVVSIMGLLAGLVILGRFRNRVAYWL